MSVGKVVVEGVVAAEGTVGRRGTGTVDAGRVARQTAAGVGRVMRR